MPRRPERARTRAHRARYGFTMLEAIVSLAIVALVSVGVLGAYAGSLRADTVAADRLPLAALAVERLATVDLASGDLARLPDSTAHGTYVGAYDGVRWDIETHGVNTVPGLTDIIVRVFDTNDSYTLRTRRYRTPVSDATGAR
ncbi:MAG: prepilin-type N-terminal cleavage/methylation domain-containing protein [bacterium]